MMLVCDYRNGTDFLWGGYGSDLLVGGAGNDKLSADGECGCQLIVPSGSVVLR